MVRIPDTQPVTTTTPAARKAGAIADNLALDARVRKVDPPRKRTGFVVIAVPDPAAATGMVALAIASPSCITATRHVPAARRNTTLAPDARQIAGVLTRTVATGLPKVRRTVQLLRNAPRLGNATVGAIVPTCGVTGS